MIKLVVIDLDGTLLTESQIVPQKTIDVIKNLVKHGIYVVLASGRGTIAVTPIQKQLQILGQPMILQNGVIVKNGSKIKIVDTIPRQVMNEIFIFCEKEKLNFSAFFGDNEIIIANNQDEFQRYVHNKYNLVFNITLTESLEKANEISKAYSGPNKINIIDKDVKVIDYAMAVAKKRFEDKVSMLKTGAYYIDFAPYKISKGEGLKILLRELGINKEETLAIGDAENDIEMMKLSGIAVAMKNALNQVKAVADYITEDNEHEGVRLALERFIEKDVIN